MFTGIVQGTAQVSRIVKQEGLNTVLISFPPGKAAGVAIGASVAVNGTCLTVTEIQGDVLRFDIMVETLRATNLGGLAEGGIVNFERSARVGDEIGAQPPPPACWPAASPTPHLQLRGHHSGAHPPAGAAAPHAAAPGASAAQPAGVVRAPTASSAVACLRSLRRAAGGHNVSGHVHTTAKIVDVEDTANNRRVTFQLADGKWMKYVLSKGYIAVDGCSLTIGGEKKGG